MSLMHVFISLGSDHLESAKDGISVLLGTGFTSEISSNVLALGNGAEGSLFNLIGVLVQAHVPVHQYPFTKQESDSP
jgi:hypothetical protein